MGTVILKTGVRLSTERSEEIYWDLLRLAVEDEETWLDLAHASREHRPVTLSRTIGVLCSYDLVVKADGTIPKDVAQVVRACIAGQVFEKLKPMSPYNTSA